MTAFATRHIGVPALILSLGITTGSFTEASHAMPGFQPNEPETQPAQDDVDALLAQARDHMIVSEWAQALDAYEAVLKIDPDNEVALGGRTVAQARLDQGSGVQDIQQDQAIRAQQARQVFDAAMAKAQQHLDSEQFEDSRLVVITAQVELGRNQGDLSESDYATRDLTASDLLSSIRVAKERYDLVQQVRTEQEAKDERTRASQIEEMRRIQQIEANIRRVRELQMQLQYGEALQVVAEILFMDPNNPTALLLRDVLQTAQMFRGYMTDERQKEMSLAWTSQQTRQRLQAPMPNYGPEGPRGISELMVYPEDWPQLSMRRTSDLSFAETAQNRRVAMVLNDTNLPVDFQSNSLEQVVTFIQQVTGVDVHADWKALEFIGVNKDDQIDLNLSNVNVQTVLDRVMEQFGDDLDRPHYAIQDGMLIISSEDAIRKHVDTRVHPISDLLLEVPYFDNAPALDLDAAMQQGSGGGGGMNANIAGGYGGGGGGIGGIGGGGGGIGGGRGAGGGGNIFTGGDEDADRHGREELISQIIDVIQEHVDPEGWRDLGGDTGSLQELGGNLIITNTPKAHREIDGLLSMLREIRALQINVEARFLTVNMNWFEKIGFDLDLYFNTNNTMTQQARATDPLFQLGDFFDDSTGRLKDPLVFGFPPPFDDTNFGNQVPFGSLFGVPVDTDGDGIPDTITYGVGAGGSPIRNTQGFAPIGLPQNSFNLVDLLGNFGSDSFAGEILNNAPALSLGIQFLDDIQVDLLIEATQADRRNLILTSPRLTLFNGQRSWVMVGTQTSYVSALIPIVGDSSGAFQPILDTLVDGVVLDIEAVISADRRYVTMTVITAVAQVISIEEVTFTGAAGGGGDLGGGGGGAAIFNGVVQLPEIAIAQIQTTVSVPDKGTVLLGGQRLVEEVEVEVGVPVLSKIPFLNRFFTNRVTSKDEATLLILIRPEIIIQQENEDLLFPGLGDAMSGGGGYGRY